MNPFGPIGIDPVIELVFSLIVITTCFVIFFKTKEIYELTEYKGIKYFRYTFVFLGLSYIFRIGMGLFKPLPTHEILLSPLVKSLIIQISAVLTIYAVSLMFLYLLLTIFWEKLDRTIISKPIFIHGISLFVVFFTYLQKVHYLFILFQLTAFIIIIFAIINKKRLFHKKQNIWITIAYIMIFGHWILIQFLEFFAIAFPKLGTIIYLVTMCFFVILFDRILIHFSNKNGVENAEERKTRNNKRHLENNKRRK